MAEWEIERLSWGSNNSAGAFASPLKLVVAGKRSSSSGTLGYTGSTGYYWAGTPYLTDYSDGLIIPSGGAFVFSTYRAYGFSVRCLKD
jgi:hypothetical protein